MTDREAFNKTKRVFYAAGKFCGMSTREAKDYSTTEAARLWPEETACRTRLCNARRRERMSAGDDMAFESEARRILSRDRRHAKNNGYTPLQESPESLGAKLRAVFCECCGVAFKSSKDRQTDHCHVTGKFRGMICRDCNCAEGHLKTSARARQLLAYMEKHGA